MQAETRFRQLFGLHTAGVISPSERKEMMDLIAQAEHDALLRELMLDAWSNLTIEHLLDDGQAERMLQHILHGEPIKIPVYRRGWFKVSVAAAVLLIIAGSYLFWPNSTKHTETLAGKSLFKNDIAPGMNGAKIKLSNGKTLLIDSLKDGLIAMEGNVQVIKENGKIFYKGLSELPADAALYNEIIEDKGRFTSVQLPDGSTAWINSGSSIRYPLVFRGGERKITMTGRAAFLAVHNEKQPFRVYASGQVFEDKGTEFNIDAYETRAVRMTVREGSVQVKNILAKANEQVKVNETGEINLIKDIDTGPVFAWRNNEFDFTRATVEDIMQEAARWYDIEVVYQGKIDQRFSLTVSRDKPISALLRNMELSGGIHFEIEGKKVTVKP